MRHFLVAITMNTAKYRDFSRCYHVAGRKCVIVRTIGKKVNRPRFRWVNDAPAQYEGVDITGYFHNSYLVPFAIQPAPKKEIEIDTRPARMECGVVVYESDQTHYAQLRAKLEKKVLFT